MPAPFLAYVYAVGGVTVAAGVTSAVCSVIHLVRSIQRDRRDRRVEDERRLVDIERGLREGKSLVIMHSLT